MAKHAVIVARHGAKHQETWGKAFAEGLRRHGWTADVRHEPEAAELLVIWGVRRTDWIRRQQMAGEIAILERTYLGPVVDRASISFGGGLNGRGIWRVPQNDPSRWEKYFAHLMQPWRQCDDGPVLILGQVPTDAAVIATDIEDFYRRARSAFEGQGFKVAFRPHPKVRQPARPLAEDLAAARFAVTWNSTSGVDAVLAGVPTVAMDQGSMAWAVTGHELKPPPAPDRMSWAHRLAWCQWTMEEMRSGYCWEIVGQ